jgi:hypothetical protein
MPLSRLSPTSPQFNRVLAIVLGIVAALLIAHSVHKGFLRDRQQTRSQQARARHLAETPSTDNLPKVKVVQPDQMLIMDDFGPYVPGSAGKIERIPPAPRPWWPQAYGIRYAPPSARKSGPNVGPYIEVEVREYPNASWAKYDMVEEQLSRGLVDAAKPLKFGCQLYGQANVEQGQKRGFYFWSSENKLVIVSFYAADPDKVLQGYLEKFPPPPPDRS